jgi:PTS system mannose-specific IIA component
MMGGTPTNIAASFLSAPDLEVITGVNLPMLIRLCTQAEGEELAEVARRVLEQGRRDICQASEILRPTGEA